MLETCDVHLQLVLPWHVHLASRIVRRRVFTSFNCFFLEMCDRNATMSSCHDLYVITRFLCDVCSLLVQRTFCPRRHPPADDDTPPSSPCAVAAAHQLT